MISRGPAKPYAPRERSHRRAPTRRFARPPGRSGPSPFATGSRTGQGRVISTSFLDPRQSRSPRPARQTRLVVPNAHETDRRAQQLVPAVFSEQIRAEETARSGTIWAVGARSDATVGAGADGGVRAAALAGPRSELRVVDLRLMPKGLRIKVERKDDVVGAGSTQAQLLVALTESARSVKRRRRVEEDLRPLADDRLAPRAVGESRERADDRFGDLCEVGVVTPRGCWGLTWLTCNRRGASGPLV